MPCYTSRMRFSRQIHILSAACILCAALTACTQNVSVPAGTPHSPSPAAIPVSPSPQPVIAVFGAEESDSFQKGVSKAAESGAYPVEFYSGETGTLSAGLPGSAALAIVYLGDNSDGFDPVDFPVYVYAASGQSVSPDIPHLTYFALNAAADALTLAVEYPPHETPVRIIGLFTSKTSDTYAVWTHAAKNGRVFSKAEYIENRSNQTAEKWFQSQLESFYPGTVDAVFAETGELAVAAADILTALGRTDMEVFAASADENAELMLSPTLIAVVGANAWQAGMLCYENASALLAGETIGNAQIGSSVFRYSPARP